MKKAVVFSIVCLIILSLMGCSNASSSTNTPSPNYSYVAPTQKTLSTSEKKELAKNEALTELEKYLKQHYNYGAYNLDATKVSIGSIIEDGSSFDVSGKLYLYDKYGSIKDIATFSTSVGFHSDGTPYLNGSIYITIN